MNRILDVLLPVLTLAMVALIVLTLYATDRSIIRTACYRHAKAVSECEPPNAVERFVRAVTP